jgi:hypothetical protein
MFREGTNPIQRAIRYVLVNLIQYFKGSRAKDIDVILAGSTPPTQGVLCGLVKKRLKVPFVYNLQDIFPDSMVNANMTKEGKAFKAAKAEYDAAWAKHNRESGILKGMATQESQQKELDEITLKIEKAKNKLAEFNSTQKITAESEAFKKIKEELLSLENVDFESYGINIKDITSVEEL